MKLRRGFKFILFVFLLQNISVVGADPAPLVQINEVAWMGTSESANFEWIELKNNGSDEIILDGWVLETKDGQPKINLAGKVAGGGYFLLERTSDASLPNVTADQIFTGALGNSGEILELKNDSGLVIDSVDAASGWPAGDNTAKLTMERKDQISWANSKNSGGTPKEINSCLDVASPPVNEDDEGQTGQNNTPPPAQNQDNQSATTTPAEPAPKLRLGELLINEIVSDPDDGDEWVELYNATAREWDLSGFSIEDGSGAKTILEGKIKGEGKEKYFVIEKPKGNLNNKGDILILRSKDGDLTDQVAYGDWNDGDTLNNAPAASDPNSIARKIDGYNSFNNANDFLVTKKITKGSSNIIESPGEHDEIVTGSMCADIIITEIFPDPSGEDAEEYLELYNNGKNEIDLTGWSIGDDSEKRYAVKEKTTIRPGGYYIFLRKDTKIALNNDADSVKLYEPEKEKACKTAKYEKSIEGYSYSFDLKNKTWAWSEIITPEKENIIKKPNSAPIPSFEVPKNMVAGFPIRFDSSDTADANDDELRYFWDFGDETKNNLSNPEHTYLTGGNFNVKLSVSDGKATSSKEKIIKVLKKGEIEANSETPSLTLAKEQKNITGISLSEIFPNPLGNDLEGEFIEIWNQGEERLNLVSWILRDSSQSGQYKFSDDFWLEPGQFFALKREESGLTLNNDTDKVRMFDDMDSLMEEVEYKGGIENASYARGENNKWFWTTKVTPGKKNVIAVANLDDKKLGASVTSVKGIKASANGVPVGMIPLASVMDREIGEQIKTRGVVSVEPGILGSQFFYIVSENDSGPEAVALENNGLSCATGFIRCAKAEELKTETGAKGCGIQVYNYKKDFPALKAGDLIEVTGEISESDGERRIKTAVKDDMKIVKRGEAPKASQAGTGELEELMSGQLIRLVGEVTEKKGSQFFIDDGDGEMVAYVKTGTGIKMALVKEGDRIELTGILNRNKSGTRLLPRYQSDIVKLESGGDSGNESVEVVGEVPPGDEWQLAQRDRKMEMFKYLLIFAGAIILGLIIWLYRIIKKPKG